MLVGDVLFVVEALLGRVFQFGPRERVPDAREVLRRVLRRIEVVGFALDVKQVPSRDRQRRAEQPRALPEFVAVFDASVDGMRSSTRFCFVLEAAPLVVSALAAPERARDPRGDGRLCRHLHHRRFDFLPIREPAHLLPAGPRPEIRVRYEDTAPLVPELLRDARRRQRLVARDVDSVFSFRVVSSGTGVEVPRGVREVHVQARGGREHDGGAVLLHEVRREVARRKKAAAQEEDAAFPHERLDQLARLVRGLSRRVLQDGAVELVADLLLAGRVASGVVVKSELGLGRPRRPRVRGRDGGEQNDCRVAHIRRASDTARPASSISLATGRLTKSLLESTKRPGPAQAVVWLSSSRSSGGYRAVATKDGCLAVSIARGALDRNSRRASARSDG
mmetsp:Transcript_16335/g.50529  ORF Transcript_16335/g.50529 Transcript_16335/m.50529 type:complete len:392 (+) Transcript_16335:563-1738(+)